MVPVIVGVAVVGAGAVLLSSDKPKHTRQRVSEDTVKKAMARSGRKIHTVSEAPHDAVEEEFNIEITDNSAEQMRTVSDVVRFISFGGD